MVKKQRVSSLLLARNKKGHPVYSREDIREQYCINRKEVEVLESGRSVKFLGCFANPEESSPCSKNSLLFSCIQRKKNKKKQQDQQKRSNSDENVYETSTKEAVGRTSGRATPNPYETDDDGKSTYDDRSTDDEEYVLSGFKKRPRPVCMQKQRGWQDSDSMGGEIERTSAKRKLESSASLGSTSQQSYDFETEYARSIQRPSQLVIISRGRTEYFQPSRSVDELNDATNRHGTTVVVIPRSAKTPDISLEDRRPKHVSFDNGSLVRSNTIGGGLEDVAAELEVGPAATSTPLNTHHYHQRRAFSPPPTTTVSILPPSRNRSKERLLDRRNFGDISGESRISVSSSTMTNITINPNQNIGVHISSLPHRPRRTMMKTQATQTDLTFKDRFSLPAYLTLSPRAHKTTASTQAPNHHHIYHPARHRVKSATTRSKSTTTTATATTKISKSRSAYGALGLDKERDVRAQQAEDDDVMEVDLVGKQHRLLRSSTSRASIRRQRAFDTSQEEIMVSFKPAKSPPPLGRPIEVLLGDRPVPRLTDRKHVADISRGTSSTRVSRRDLHQSSTPSELVSPESKKTVPVLQKEKSSSSSQRDQPLPSKEEPKTVEVSEPKISEEHSEETPKSAPEQPLVSGSSEEKPEEASEASGLRTPSGKTVSKAEAESLETSSIKSSSESSRKRNRTTQITQAIPTTPRTSKLGETSTQSEESLTMTTEESLKAQEVYREKREHYMTKYQQHVSAAKGAQSQENQIESPTSPDSESSSSIFTERETSRSDNMSTSSSCNNNHHDVRLPIAKSDSESSEYVTAPDHSHRDASIGIIHRTATEETATTTFESFSSPSSRSSLHPPPQQPHPKSSPPHKSSTSPSSSTSMLPHDDDEEDRSDGPEGDGDRSSTLPRDTKMVDFDDGNLLSPPALSPPEIEEHQESSDESTKKETPPTSPSSETDDGEVPELRFSTHADDDIANAGTPDSDRTSDITPVFDASPEPLSSLLEDGVETVIEVRSENTATTTVNTSDECLDNGQRSGSPGSQNNITSSSNNGDDSKSGPRLHTESESSESSSVLSGLQDMESASRVGSGMDGGGNRIQIQLYQPSDLKPPDELSTVSEVSEESSQAEITADSKRKLFKRKTSSFSSTSESNSHQRASSTCSTGGEHGATRKSSSSEYIPSEATTPSFDSTTSGSFILENSSCSTCSNHLHFHSESCSTGKGTSECSSAVQEGESSRSESSKKTSDTPDSVSRPGVEEEQNIDQTADISQVEKPEAPQYSAEESLISEAKVVEVEVDVEPVPASVKQVSLDEHSEVQDEKAIKAASPTSSLTSELSEKLVTASSVILSATSSSSSLMREAVSKVDEKQQQEFDVPTPPRSHSVGEQEHSLSAWCSEGAIPKQKIHDTSGEAPPTTRRRKDRARMRSETRDLPAALQLLPSGYHRHCPRSKSHSPEKSDEDQDSSSGPAFKIASAKVLLCSHCGEKIKDAGGPMSAPPQGMWEMPYQRSFWEPPSSHHHHHPHQGLSWRQQQQQQRGAYGDMYGSQGSSRFGGYGGPLPRSWSTEGGPAPEAEIYPDEDEDAGIHSESYRSTTWIYVSENDELAVWKQHIDKPPPPEPGEEVDPSCSLSSVGPSKKSRLPRPQLLRSDSTESTSSEHEFLRQYQAVTHRMVHRKSSVEMYNRMSSRTFEVDKRVVVQRNNGEFGFRIHGSKPVVVSAIEKGTPAETCGLEVGDIIVCINGLNVLDASHSEVVRIAHTGTEVLKMEVTRTCHVLTPMISQSAPAPVFSGFLQRLSARSVTGRRWCRRWFAVKEDGVLYWYRTSKDHEPLGALVLQNQDISWVPEAGSPHAFKVSKFGGCQHYFSADDEETATRWISALNQVATTASRLDPYLEQSMRQAQVPPSQVASDPSDCQGYLAKLSQRWKTWRRRYFLLKDAALYFYVDRNAKVALGLFHLHGYKVQSCSLQGRKNTFEAIPPEPRLKHLYFQADSENEKKRWLAALEYSIDRWIKVG